MPETVLGRVNSGMAFFDARVFSAPDAILAAESVYWRHALDGRRNAINMVGCRFIPHKQMQGIPLSSVIEILATQHNVHPYTAYPASCMHGVFLKKRQYPHVGLNPMTGEAIPTLRARIEARSFEWRMDELQRAAMILAKYWETSHPASLELIDLASKDK